MKKFEDNIKSRFNEGEIPLDSNAFFAFEQKMKANDIRQLKFSEKIKGIFENAMIPYSAAHWNQFQQNFESSIDQELNQKLNQKLKQKLEKGEIKPNSSDSSWDSMKMKLKESELTSFEKKISEKIAGGSKNYNPEHWKSLAKQLDKPKKPFIWTYLDAAEINGLTLSYV